MIIQLILWIGACTIFSKREKYLPNRWPFPGSDLSLVVFQEHAKVPRPASMPPSPSLSRSTTPLPSDDENESCDSEEEREELAKRETPTRESGRESTA